MDYKFDTLAIHAGYTPDETGSRAAPIYMTTAYAFDNTEQARRRFALEEGGNIYSRLQNPTNTALEERINALEGGVGALAASSGHAAMTMMFLNIAKAGDEIVSARNIYGGAMNLMGKTFAQMGIKFIFVDGTDPENFARATTDKTRAYFLETLGNPFCDILDVEAIAKIAHSFGIPLIADNTEATPALFKPFEHGADISVYSTTKFLSGTGTVMGGVIVDSGNFVWKDNPRFPAFNTPDESYHGVVYADACGKAAFITKLRTHILRDIGACQSPFNSWITMLGIETLSLRMGKHSSNALAVAEFLNGHDFVSEVSYPGLASSPYNALAKRYFPKGQSSVYCFDIKGTREQAVVFCVSLKMISIVANLGDCRTIVSCPAVTTHSQLSDSELAAVGIKPGTIRLSVGIEDERDIIADIAQALDKAMNA